MRAAPQRGEEPAEEERPLAGLGAFSGKVGVATVVAVVVAAVSLWAYGPGSGGAVRDATRAALEGDPPTRAPAPAPANPALATAPAPATPQATAPVPAPGPAPQAEAAAAAVLSPEAEKAAAFAREAERRRAAGAVQQAVKRFAPCGTNDVRRAATIDGDAVVKIDREQGDGLLVEEWFDGEGRLREARVTRPGVSSARRILLDERGRALVDTGAAGGALEPARLDRDNPSGAFFEVPVCKR